MIDEKTQEFILAHRTEDVRTLALKRTPDGVDAMLALQQIEGWQTAVRKLPSWATTDGLWYPPRLSMEQCSSEQTALYKNETVKRLLNIGDKPSDGSMMDLTGGFGIDFSFLAPLFARAVYMERQPELCRIARHNFNVLRLHHAEIMETDSSAQPQDWPNVELCFVDPARRDASGRKTVAIDDCTPNLKLLQEHIQRKARLCLVKLSPMLDIHAAVGSLNGVSEVHAVCVQGECKELLLVMQPRQTGTTHYHCVNITAGQTERFVFSATEEAKAQCHYTEQVGHFLYEPNAAILKCGGYRCLAQRYGLLKLHPNSHLYTSDNLCENFPGRTFTVEGLSGFGKKELHDLLHGLPQANLTVRNFPAGVAEMRKRLRLKEGGDTYLFATLLNNERHILIKCRKLQNKR
ncbi:MAG: hypothetical protein NC388_04020 [Clostridium sp.]|nr:hypothetical protein [Clostridium sp.]